jgi:membrane protease YdiL (CAAX protease family)
VKIWLFAAFLILWGNLLHPFIGSSAVLPGGSWPFVAAGAALVALSLSAARALRLDASGLGLARRGAIRGAALGALAGAAIAGIGVAAFRVAPAIVGQSVSYEPLARVSSDDLMRQIAVFLPLGAVIPEEIAFRGTLLGALLQRGDVRLAAVGSAATFALWHATVAVVTVANTTVPVVLVIPAIAGAFVILLVGGVLLAGLRLATGALATSVAAHWAFNAVILVGLWPGSSLPAQLR